MAKRKSSAIRFPVLSPSLQVDFWARLQQIRSQYLSESLAQTVRSQDIEELDRELLAIIGSERLRALAAYSLRGETFYAVPCILKAKPLLLGYYRLLYGLSQKEFYRGVFGRFRPMEQDNQLNAQNDELLPGLCRSLAQTGWTLFNGIQPVSQQVIHELQLLTVGPQLRGSRNVAIGKGATKIVFDLISGLVSGHCESSTAPVITVKNAAGRIVQIAFAPDPDTWPGSSGNFGSSIHVPGPPRGVGGRTWSVAEMIAMGGKLRKRRRLGANGIPLPAGQEADSVMD